MLGENVSLLFVVGIGLVIAGILLCMFSMMLDLPSSRPKNPISESES